jgi:hypothetical protein
MLALAAVACNTRAGTPGVDSAATAAQGFADLVCVERQGMFDEVRFRITVTNALGASRAVEKWDFDVHARFDALLAAIMRAATTLPPDLRRQIAF